MFFFFLDFILFLEREEGREKEEEKHGCVREKHRSVASCTHPHQEPKPQPRHVPRLGIEPVTFTLCGMTPDLLSHTGQGTFQVLTEHSVHEARSTRQHRPKEDLSPPHG